MLCIGLLFLPLAYLLDCYLGKIVKNVYSYPENYSYRYKSIWGIVKKWNLPSKELC